MINCKLFFLGVPFGSRCPQYMVLAPIANATYRKGTSRIYNLSLFTYLFCLEAYYFTAG